MDASINVYIKNIKHNLGELNVNKTEPRLYLILEDLLSIVVIQERNISALEKELTELKENR